MFPEDFIRSLPGILTEEETGRLIEALWEEAPAAVRFNPYKLSAPPEGRQVPWCRYGFYTGERPAFTLDPLHHAGVYYVQEPSSMFVEHIVRELFPEPEGLRILDLCAAPGGKTTLLSTLAGLEGLVVANETVSHRASVLAENVRRWGLGNVAVTANDPAHFSAVRDLFDIVLVDAPCSGEGMFRKNPEARRQWSLPNVEMCAVRQRKIVADAWSSLKPGGVLIYSTCTFNRTENEENAVWTAGNFDCSPVEVDCPPEWGITTVRTPAGQGEEITTYRFYPHRTEGEGFCVTVLRKSPGKARTSVKPLKKSPIREVHGKEKRGLSGWVTQPGFMRFGAVGDDMYGYYAAAFDDIVRLSGGLNVIYAGVAMGRIMKERLRPEHSLALFHDLNTSDIPACEVDLETALDYLRRKDIPADGFAEGYNLVTYGGHGLGWVKKIGARVNNLLPKELRIMNL
ncbi:MAG: rRNA cytosine-C5-methylase [Rikenellaceae bacterium]|nr:rRNA cytosine-C5-methylase [Rikenellaceae bacterium]